MQQDFLHMNWWPQFVRRGFNVQGCSLEYRRFGCDWPAPWRARIHSNYDGLRIEAYGETPDDAMRNAIQQKISCE